LFLNPVRMESIVGMEDKEALALIDDLMRHATRKKYEYRHRWRPHVGTAHALSRVAPIARRRRAWTR
jgi:hypothetical protein